MDKNKANLDQVSKPYLVQNQLECLMTNSQFSDVSFLVEDEVILAHKSILSMGSPVFEKMLFGDLKMDTTKPIELPDIKAIGFKNVLKYIYTNKIEFEYQYFNETYLVADKYLVYHMTDALIDYLVLDLKVSNCCLIYDQMMNFQNVNQSQLDNVKMMIIDNAKEAFESEYFNKIQPTTLISLLNFDELNISELNLLKACWRYVNDNVAAFEKDSSKESKQKLFGQFKHFIRFDNLDPNDLANFDGILDLLISDEIASLLLHLHNPKMPLNINCLTKRKDYSPIYSILFDCEDNGVLSEHFDDTILKVNEKVNIKVIHTFVETTTMSDLNVLVCNNQGQDLKLEIEKFNQNGNWSFKLKCFEVQKNVSYRLKFDFNTGTQVSIPISFLDRGVFKIDKKKINFDLHSDDYGFHFVKKIDFSIPN